jgi:hypothetical protein
VDDVIISDVMDELGNQLDTIDGLRVHNYEADDINVPAGLISLPRSIDFSTTYNRGMDKLVLNAVILVSVVGDKIRRDEIAPYADGAGPKSVKQILESTQYSSFDTIFVAKAVFDIFRFVDVDYLGLRFDINIAGEGSG